MARDFQQLYEWIGDLTPSGVVLEVAFYYVAFPLLQILWAHGMFKSALVRTDGLATWEVFAKLRRSVFRAIAVGAVAVFAAEMMAHAASRARWMVVLAEVVRKMTARHERAWI